MVYWQMKGYEGIYKISKLGHVIKEDGTIVMPRMFDNQLFYCLQKHGTTRFFSREYLIKNTFSEDFNYEFTKKETI